MLTQTDMVTNSTTDWTGRNTNRQTEGTDFNGSVNIHQRTGRQVDRQVRQHATSTVLRNKTLAKHLALNKKKVSFEFRC